MKYTSASLLLAAASVLVPLASGSAIDLTKRESYRDRYDDGGDNNEKQSSCKKFTPTKYHGVKITDPAQPVTDYKKGTTTYSQYYATPGCYKPPSHHTADHRICVYMRTTVTWHVVATTAWVQNYADIHCGCKERDVIAMVKTGNCKKDSKGKKQCVYNIVREDWDIEPKTTRAETNGRPYQTRAYDWPKETPPPSRCGRAVGGNYGGGGYSGGSYGGGGGYKQGSAKAVDGGEGGGQYGAGGSYGEQRPDSYGAGGYPATGGSPGSGGSYYEGGQQGGYGQGQEEDDDDDDDDDKEEGGDKGYQSGGGDYGAGGSYGAGGNQWQGKGGDDSQWKGEWKTDEAGAGGSEPAPNTKDYGKATGEFTINNGVFENSFSKYRVYDSNTIPQAGTKIDIPTGTTTYKPPKDGEPQPKGGASEGGGDNKEEGGPPDAKAGEDDEEDDDDDDDDEQGEPGAGGSQQRQQAEDDDDDDDDDDEEGAGQPGAGGSQQRQQAKEDDDDDDDDEDDKGGAPQAGGSGGKTAYAGYVKQAYSGGYGGGYDDDDDDDDY